MTRAIISLILLPILFGCISRAVSAGAQALPAGYHRLDDPLLTPEETRAVSVAREYLENHRGKWIETYYHPRKAKEYDGYYVDIRFLVEDEAGGKPKLVDPCSSVRVSADWGKADYIRW